MFVLLCLFFKINVNFVRKFFFIFYLSLICYDYNVNVFKKVCLKEIRGNIVIF